MGSSSLEASPAAPRTVSSIAILCCVLASWALAAWSPAAAAPPASNPPPLAPSGNCSLHDVPRGALYELSALGSLSWASPFAAYIFDACENLQPVRGSFCHLQRAPALQRLAGAHHLQPCPRLGDVAARSAEALSSAPGVRVRYGGGEACGGYGGPKRNMTIDVACADRATPRVLGVEEVSSCNYHARVEAREGCPLECVRDSASSAVCGGAARGKCAVAAGAGGARCVCTPPRSGPACELEAPPPAAPGASDGLALGVGARTLLMGALSLAVLAGCATRRLRGRPALLACAAVLALAAAPSDLFDAARPRAAAPAFRAVDAGHEAPAERPAAVSHVRVLFAAAGGGPLRRHAILLTGAIRDMQESFPSLLRLLRGTQSGFDVYAVLSPTRGGWTNADRDEAEDEAALAWLRALPDADPRVSLQLLAYDTTPTLEPLSEELIALFPGYSTYDFRKMMNPGINLLLELKKLLNVWDFMRARCESAGAAPPPLRTARGRHCYDMLVRSRPDMRWQDSSEPAFARGLDLDRLWDAWGGGGSPFSMAVPWINGTALVGTSKTPPPPAHAPPLRVGGAACLHTGARAELPADEGPYAFLPFFGPAFGNNFGGPSDMFMMGPWEAMQLFFPRAPLVEALTKAQVGFHPEELVRCGMVELLRRVDAERRESGAAASPMPVLEHVVLSIHYCRHYGAGASSCF